jgi:glycosyltransferase involved in cell wall biosynthesis
MPVPLTAGGGTRLKVLEAFAAGVPVVSTAKGVEGLGLDAGRHFLRAEDPAAFADGIRRLDADPSLARRCVEEASTLVRRAYSYAALDAAITAALADAAARADR